jgi:8-oxo-dGTP diphosphatase
MTSASQIPRIGIGVFVISTKTGEFILGKRKGSHGTGTWALPGGHLELQESFEDCAKREALEETGLEITDVQFLTATNSPRVDGNKHYVTVFVAARRVDDSIEPQLVEPNKCEGWKWISWDEFVDWYTANNRGDVAGNKLFQPMIDFIEQRPNVRPRLLLG